MKLENIIVIIVFSLLFTAYIAMFCAIYASLLRIHPIVIVPIQQKDDILNELDNVQDFKTVYKIQTV